MAINLSGRIVRPARISGSWSGAVTWDTEKVRQVSDEIRAKALEMARDSAHKMASVVRMMYPQRTGRLRAGIRVDDRSDRSVVLSEAPHAKVFELGSPPHRMRSRRGSTGQMPRARIFIPVAVRTRQTLRNDLQALLKQDREII